jgi:Protein of unknown function (DUF2569)
MNEITSMDLTWNPGTAAARHPEGKGNWLAIVLAVLFAGVFAGLAFVFYKHSVTPARETPESLPIGGGLVLLAIGLLFTPMGEITGICKMAVFDYSYWINVSDRQDLGNITVVQLFLIMEMMINVFMLAYSILLAVLFFQRRDTFPFALATFYIIDTVFIYADNSLNQYFFQTEKTQDMLSISSILWPLLRMAIWVPYLLISQRGKNTFTIPYRPPQG